METTIVKGLKVLETLVQSGGPRSLTEIALQCGISKSNAHRVLGTLEACGYVTRPSGSRNYELTLRLWELGQRVFSRVDIRSVAMPHLRTLASETGETVHLSVLDNNQALYIDKVDSTHAVRAYVNIGDRAPAYCSATGKAMLAHAPDEIVEAASANMQRFTRHTVSSPTMLRRQLASIREQGYSLTNGEWREGVLGFGRAILSPSGRPIAAIGVAGPEERMRQGGVDRYVSVLLAAGEAIEGALGFRDAPIGLQRDAAATSRAAPRRQRPKA